jgi:hypothetical protein
VVRVDNNFFPCDRVTRPIPPSGVNLMFGSCLVFRSNGCRDVLFSFSLLGYISVSAGTKCILYPDTLNIGTSLNNARCREI